jgi:hypothetical protein
MNLIILIHLFIDILKLLLFFDKSFGIMVRSFIRLMTWVYIIKLESYKILKKWQKRFMKQGFWKRYRHW